MNQDKFLKPTNPIEHVGIGQDDGLRDPRLTNRTARQLIQSLTSVQGQLEHLTARQNDILCELRDKLPEIYAEIEHLRQHLKALEQLAESAKNYVETVFVPKPDKGPSKKY